MSLVILVPRSINFVSCFLTNFATSSSDTSLLYNTNFSSRLLFLKNSGQPKTIKEILKFVWGYSKEIETHTVETHVHRLRKKFFNSFNDSNFIKNNKKGYYI